MTDDPVILFLVDDARRAGIAKASHHWLAAEAGFRSLVVPWRAVSVAAGATTVRGGYEIMARGARRRLRGRERVTPAVVVHRTPVSGACARLIGRLARAHPEALLSYHPCWKPISRKWTAELCFRDGETAGIRVPRPETHLVDKRRLVAELAPLGDERPLILKPSSGSQCRGVQLSRPGGFAAAAGRARRSRWPRFVVQELLQDCLLYRGLKVDLRLYALVSSFSPLRYTLYPGGVARLAAQAFDPAMPAEGLRALTGCSYRKRRRVRVENLPVGELLERLADDGVDVARFWARADAVVGAALACLALYPPLAGARLDGRFYLTGLDVLPLRRGDGCELAFLETNHYPQLNAWGDEVDRALWPVHRAWLEDLRSAPARGEQPAVALVAPGRGRNPELARIARALRPAAVVRPDEEVTAGAVLHFPASGHRDANAAVARRVADAARSGLATNAAGADARWGRKDELELLLRAYERATGRAVRRPETIVAAGPQIPAVVASFAARGLECIVKPANRSRGEGHAIVPAGASPVPAVRGGAVVQRLATAPLLIAGHKADLRCYALVDCGRPERSRRVGPAIVRLAPAPYIRGRADAEITNGAWRRRLGLPPATFLLERAPGIDEALVRRLAAGLDALTGDLLDAHRWWAGERGGRRVLLWGLDVLATPGGELSLLEINVHPRLFRGEPHCDAAVAEMLRTVYLPALAGS
jgi:hypothetical protein